MSLGKNGRLKLARQTVTLWSRPSIIMAILLSSKTLSIGYFLNGTGSRSVSLVINVGGARAIEQLRQVVIELEMVPIRSAIHIPTEVYLAVRNEKAPVNPELFKPLREGMRGDRVETFFNELINCAKVLKAANDSSD